MKLNKLLGITLLLGAAYITTSCDGFFDVAPKDSLSPATFWRTENDAQQAATACYNNWVENFRVGSTIFYEDCMSDIAYNYTKTGNYAWAAIGSMNNSNAVDWFRFTTITRCNFFLENIDQVEFKSEAVKKDLIAQIRTIRAYYYFRHCFWYGGVPLITQTFQTAEEAQLPRTPEAEVQKFVLDELSSAIPDLNDKPSERGRIAKGTALAIKMRAELYWGKYSEAREDARKIVALNQYELDPNFIEMFSLAGQGSKEIIYAYQYLKTTAKYSDAIRFFNNADGGWASWVPTTAFVDMFEMNNGMLIDEPGSGYDPVHPYANRDPRLYLEIIYPGREWTNMNGVTRIFNTVDKTLDGKANADYYLAADNASKTGIIFRKYCEPMSQYAPSLSDTQVCPIIFRYAEVLLTIAECDVELNDNLTEALDLIDRLRQRGGQIVVDRSKYVTQDQIRQLVRRERTIELADEGFRRQDIVRWKDANGQLVAKSVMKPAYRMIGTIDYNEPDPTRRFVQTLPTPENEAARFLEDRKFEDYQRYLPLRQAELDKNPNLTQTPGY